MRHDVCADVLVSILRKELFLPISNDVFRRRRHRRRLSTPSHASSTFSCRVYVIASRNLEALRIRADFLVSDFPAELFFYQHIDLIEINRAEPWSTVSSENGSNVGLALRAGEYSK